MDNRNIVGFSARDPDELVEQLAPVAGGITVTPIGRSTFQAGVRFSQFHRLGLFTVHTSHFRVLANPNDYSSISVPLTGSLDAVDGDSVETFTPGSAYVLNSGDSVDWRISNGTRVLVITFRNPVLSEYANKLNGGVASENFHLAHRLSLTASEGAEFWRYLNFVWNEANRDATWLDSSLITQEVQNALLALALRATSIESQNQENRGEGTWRQSKLHQAEEYIIGHLSKPVSLADIADVANMNTRTLSRAFQKRHGLSPIAFLKARRLEAVQRALIDADPESTTVTSIALSFGFNHLGRFSTYYRKMFHEAPSETLKR